MTDINAFNDRNIRETTRRHLLEAFLRYDMFCKVYLDIDHNLEEESLSTLQVSYGIYGKYASTSSNSNESLNGDKLVSWDWGLLQKYRKDEISNCRVRSLACICEYITTLYDGMIADNIKPTPWKDEWEDGREVTFYPLDQFQDGQYVSGEWSSSMHDLQGKLQPLQAIVDSFDEDENWKRVIPNILASADFALLSSILHGGQEHFRQLLLRLCRRFCHQLPRRDLVSSFLPFLEPQETIHNVYRAS
jgi:hypothetical protein